MLIDIVNDNDKIYINGTKKILIPLIKDKSFKKVLKQSIKELNKVLLIFIESKGLDFKELQNKKIDLNEVLASCKNYKIFITKYQNLQKNIESAQYISENPVYLERKIDKSLTELKQLLGDLYFEHKISYKINEYPNILSGIVKKTFIYSSIVLLLIFLALIAYILIQELIIRL